MLPILGGMVLVARVHAQPAPSEADRLFEEGRVLAKDGKYAEACERFGKSFELDPTVGTELNLADCHEKQGHLREAWQLFEAAAAEAARTGDDKRTKFAHDRAAVVASKMVVLLVKVAEPARDGLAITIGGRAVSAAPEVRERVEPGDIAVIASVPGKPKFETTAKGVAGATVVVEIPPFTDRPPPRPDVAQRRDRARVVLAFGIAAGGAASGITALAVTLKGKSDYNATVDSAHCMRVTGGFVCDDTGDAAIARSQRLANIGTGFAIAAGVLVGASAVVYFTAPREPVAVAPSVTATSAGVVVRGRF